MNKTDNTKAIPPQNGIVTNHHDQLIIFVNFKTTKATPKRPKTPIPELELLLIIFCFYYFIFYKVN